MKYLPLIESFTVNNNVPLIEILKVNNHNLPLIKIFAVSNYYLLLIKLFTISKNINS